MEHDPRESRPRRPFETADVEKTQAPLDMIARDLCTQPGRPYSDEELVAELFKHHAPNERTIPKFAAINQAAKNLAEVILANVPRGADRIRAIEAVRAAGMLANAGVSLNGLSLY